MCSQSRLIEAISTVQSYCGRTSENRHHHPCRRGCKRTAPAGILRRELFEISVRD